MTHFETASKYQEQINKNIIKRRRLKAVAIPCGIIGAIAAIVLISIYYLKENAELFYLICGYVGVAIFAISVILSFIIAILGQKNENLRYKLVVETREMEKEMLREGKTLEGN